MQVRWTYRPELDGLRAVAVLAVLGVHVGYVRGGYQGVDLFFVLSGYLITSILLAERERTGRLDVWAFYVRRWLRLYPALLATVLIVVPVCAELASLERRTETLKSGVFALTYTMNLAQNAGHGYSFFLDHTWSLGVEEQFYLVWPLVILVLSRFARVPVARMLLVATGVLLVTRVAVAVETVPIRASGLPPMDWAGLVLGAAIAFAPPAARRFRTSAALVASVAALVLVASFVPGQSSRPGAYWGPQVTTLAAGVLVAHLVAGGIGRSVLSSHVPVWIGKRAYGLYLYQFPLAALLRYRVDSKPLAAVLVTVATFFLAEVSFRYVETPFLRRKARYARADGEAATTLDHIAQPSAF